MRHATIGLVTLAFPLVTLLLSEIIKPITQIPYAHLCSWMLSRFPRHVNDDEDLHPLRRFGAARHYVRKLLPLLVLTYVLMVPTMLVIIWGAGQTKGTFSNSLNVNASIATLTWDESLYFAYVTASTIGFGDICPSNNHGRLAVMAVMAIGLSIFSLYVDTIAAAVESRKAAIRLWKHKGAGSCQVSASSLLNALGRDGSYSGGISRSDFTLRMLVDLGSVSAADIEALQTRFDELASGGSILTHEKMRKVSGCILDGLPTGSSNREMASLKYDTSN